jgi:hypothetical protein
VYNGSEVECGVGLGEACEDDYCIAWFIHCLVYLVVFNTDSSTFRFYSFLSRNSV